MPSKYWVLNMAGFRLSDENMRSIPHPRVELTTHVTMKAIQACTILAGGIIAPAVCTYRGDRDFKTITDKAYQYGMYGAIIAHILGPVLTFARVNKAKEYAVWDRCYRLRYNKNQMRTDRMSLFGAIAGTGAAYYIGEQLGRGLLFGFCGGCLFGTAMNFII